LYLQGLLSETMFEPFKIPDFSSRPDGLSMSLKQAYIYLRKQDFPDKDIFIYAQGEFDKFKGEIIEQQPQGGDIVYPGNRVTLTAAVAGICEMMPDLFTDHAGRSFADDKNPRLGAKKLFAVFDSAILKMLCRLEWVRDIYAGIDHSSRFIEYINSIFADERLEIDNDSFKSLGFISSRLSQYLGTEGALKAYFDTVIDLKISMEPAANHKVPLPEQHAGSPGAESKLSENIFLGDSFESEKSDVNLGIRFDKQEDIQKTIDLLGDRETLGKLFQAILPFYLEKCDFSIEDDGESAELINGNSNLGFNSRLNPLSAKGVDRG
jgi:hypothetical protein